MRKTLELAGNKYGRLKAIRSVGSNKHNQVQWECTCECGNTVNVVGSKLVSGYTRSCGCLQKDTMREAQTKHGLRNTNEYNSWCHIKRRCYDTFHTRYPDYGGRGITMCDEWRKSFKAFYDDMGPKPSPIHSVERRDNDKGYCKENCYWATPTEQNNNTRSNIFFEYNGVSRTLAAWCRELNLNYSSVHGRLRKGFSFEDAINFKVDVNK